MDSSRTWSITETAVGDRIQCKGYHFRSNFEWSYGVEFWSGFWSGMEFFFLTLIGQSFTTDGGGVEWGRNFLGNQ